MVNNSKDAGTNTGHTNDGHCSGEQHQKHQSRGELEQRVLAVARHVGELEWGEEGAGEG